MKIYLIEDRTDSRQFFYDFFKKRSINIEMERMDSIKDIQEENSLFEVIFINIDISFCNIYELIKSLSTKNPTAKIMVLLNKDTHISSAIKALKAGAYDCIEYPWETNIIPAIMLKPWKKERAADTEKLVMESSEVIGVSTSADVIRKFISKISESSLAVLIEGESGVGKGVVARAIHKNSLRANKAFIPINCSTLPEELLENELFGHEPGAFSGANLRKRGLFEVANEGTLFIDEIGDMDVYSQAKLLTVIETGKFRRLGDVKEMEADVRIIAATNKVLENEVAEKKFRLDLFYRLGVLRLLLPPLRERKEDIPYFADSFINNYYPGRKLGKDAVEIMLKYHWPGNIRELYNVIKRACVLSENPIITAADIQPQLSNRPVESGGSGPAAANRDTDILQESIENAEKEIIVRALNKYAWNKSEAAKILKISRDTMYRKIRKYNIRFSA